MKTTATLSRLEIFIGSATLAAHASSSEEGFRQRDVRFFCELFMNWSDDLTSMPPPIQNTQIARYVEELVRDGYARCQRRGRAPAYRLTRLGLLDVTSRIVSPRDSSTPSHFLFVVTFLRCYRARIEGLIKREGKQFPLSLKMELEVLLDTTALIRAEVVRVERAIGRLQARIRDSSESAALVKRRLAAGTPFVSIVDEVEERYPYELNTQKPLSELMQSIVAEQRQWELEHGGTLRNNNLWMPQLRILKEYRLQLMALAAE